MKAYVEGFSYPITYSAEADKEDIMETVFSSTGSYELDGVRYHFFNFTISGIVFDQNIHFGYETENYILLAHIHPSSDMPRSIIETYLGLMKYVSIVGEDTEVFSR